VFVPAECVVGKVNEGWQVARTTLANERVALSSSWGYGSGVTEVLHLAAVRGGCGGEAAPDGAAAGAAAGGWPAADLRQLGHLVCEGQALDLLGLRVTLKQLSAAVPGATSSVRKLLGMQHAQRIADFCLAVLGPEGALGARDAAAVWRPDGTPDISGPAAGAYWSRQVLFTRALTIGGGTTDIQLNIIAERLLGLPRDPEPGS
jgi:alkylation response protein AidB-like acyl-CoA dehydrogenase